MQILVLYALLFPFFTQENECFLHASFRTGSGNILEIVNSNPLGFEYS